MKKLEKINGLLSRIGYNGDYNNFKKDVLKELSSQDLEIVSAGNLSKKKFEKVLASVLTVLSLSGIVSTNAMIEVPVPADYSNDLFEDYDPISLHFSNYKFDGYYFVQFSGDDNFSLKSKAAYLTSFKEFKSSINYLIDNYGEKIFDESVNIEFPLNVRAFFNISNRSLDQARDVLYCDRLSFINYLKVFISRNRENRDLLRLASYIKDTMKYD